MHDRVTIESIKGQVDLRDIIPQTLSDPNKTKQQGDCTTGLCPFHDNRDTPAFAVYKDHYYCFSCHVWGDIFDWVRHHDGLDFIGAVEGAAKIANVPLDDGFMERIAAANKKRRRMLDDMESYELEMWSGEGWEGAEYLEGRGISQESIIEFRLGYDADRRCITFPAIDSSGTPLSYFTRYINPNSSRGKYWHRNNLWYKKSDHLYNCQSLKRDCTAFVAEGPFDVISIHQLDIGPVVGFNGSALSERQIATLRTMCDSVVLVGDAKRENDFRLLRKNVDRLRAQAPDLGIKVAVPPGEDANASEPEALRAALLAPVAPEQALLDLVVHGDREDQYARARNYIATIDDMLVRDDIIRRLAERWEKPFDVARQALIDAKTKTDIVPLTIEEALDELKHEMSLPPDQKINLDWMGLSSYIKRLRTKHVVEIWARPSVGKTMAILNLMLKTQGNFGQVLFSQEQPASEIMNRLLIMASYDLGAPLSQDELDHVMIHDQEKYEFYRGLMGTMFQYTRIVDRRASTDEMRAVLSDMAITSAVPVKVVWVDYLGLIKDEKNLDEYPRISKAFYDIQEMAKEFNVLMVVAHQVSRKAGSGHQPLSLDAGRGSGVGEEVADLIIGLYKPDKTDDPNFKERKIIADVLKNRHGPTGQAQWGFHLSTLRMESR